MSKTTLATLLATTTLFAFALGGCAAHDVQGADPADEGATSETADKSDTTKTSRAALEVFCHPSIKADGTLETACDPALIGDGDGAGGGGGAGGGADNGGPNAPGGTPSAHACDDTCTDVYDDCAASCTTISCRALCSRRFRACELRCH